MKGPYRSCFKFGKTWNSVFNFNFGITHKRKFLPQPALQYSMNFVFLLRGLCRGEGQVTLHLGLCCLGEKLALGDAVRLPMVRCLPDILQGVSLDPLHASKNPGLDEPHFVAVVITMQYRRGQHVSTKELASFPSRNWKQFFSVFYLSELISFSLDFILLF
jgi:hypothetical protein